MCWIAEEGIRVWLSSVFTSRRVFTNWLGNSMPFELSNCARSFTVPVTVSIWLSIVISFPFGQQLLLRAVIGFHLSVLPPRICSRTWGRLSSASVKITVMG